MSEPVSVSPFGLGRKAFDRDLRPVEKVEEEAPEQAVEEPAPKDLSGSLTEPPAQEKHQSGEDESLKLPTLSSSTSTVVDTRESFSVTDAESEKTATITDEQTESSTDSGEASTTPTEETISILSSTLKIPPMPKLQIPPAPFGPEN